MKERPILFSAPMVRAILDGRKTQTRRVVKPGRYGDRPPEQWGDCCPFGQPGDRLWVRESFIPMPIGDGRWDIAYAAGGLEAKFTAPAGYNPTLYNYERWTPSIHMPRFASRITLEVTGVRVERLQDISEDDAKAEGIVNHRLARKSYAVPGMSDGHYLATAREVFEVLWSSLNGAGSWDANPWVWVVEFRRI